MTKRLMNSEEFDREVKLAVDLRESGEPGDAAVRFMVLEIQARDMGDTPRELSTRGQRLVCYLHLYESGTVSCLPDFLEIAQESIRKSKSIKGNPEIRTFRFRYAQALYFRKNYEASYRQLNMAIRGLHRKDPQYFQFLPLRALVSHQLAKQMYRSADEDIADSLNALDDWKKDRKDLPGTEQLALVYHTGILLKLAEIHFVNKAGTSNLEESSRIEEEVELAASGLTKMVNRLANEFNYTVRKQQWDRLKKRYLPKRATKRPR